MISNPHHLALVKLFQDNQNILDNNAWVKKYLGTTKTLYCLKTGDKIKLIKDYLKPINLSSTEFSDLLISLSSGSSFEELSALGPVLCFYPVYRNNLPIKIIDKLFDNVRGWAETDVTCTFTADDLSANWPGWKKLLTDFSIDKNIHKRRASLVLFTQPLRLSPDPRFYKLALKNVDKLKSEKDILITKAISWVLRAMIKFHSEIVKDYLKKNQDSLPHIAIREVSTKLLTGKKYNRPVK